MSVVQEFYEVAGSDAVSRALTEIDKMASRLDEKRGGESTLKRVFFSALFLAGVGACCYFALQYGVIPFSDFTSAETEMIQFLYYGSCGAMALFFFALLLRVGLNRKYYRVIISSYRDMELIKDGIKKQEHNREKRLKEMDDSEIDGYDFKLNIGNSVDQKLIETEEAISRLGFKDKKRIDAVVVFMYYCAACVFGGLLSMLMQFGCNGAVADVLSSFSLNQELKDGLSSMTFACGVAGGIIGPIVMFYYLYKLRLYPVNEWIFVPALVSGALGFFVATIMFGLIVGIIALVIAIVKLILLF